MSESALPTRTASAEPRSMPPVGASRFAGRILLMCLVAWGSILVVEGCRRIELIGELTESIGRLTIWIVLATVLAVSAVRWKLPARPMVALSVFLICTILVWVLGVADDIRLIDGTAFIDRNGILRRVLKRVLFAGWAFALGDLMYGLLRSVEHQREDLSGTIARLEDEIRNHHDTERDLNKSKAMYASLVDSLDQCVFRKDAEGRMTFCNSRFCTDLGFPMTSLLGKTDEDLYPLELARKYRADDLRVMETGITLQDIEQHVRYDGAVVNVQVIKTPIFDAAGTVIGVQGTYWDITEQHNTAEAIRQSERRLKMSLDATSTSCWELNLKSGELACTRPSGSWLGYAPEELPIDRDWLNSIVHPDDAGIAERALANHLGGRTPTYECEYRVRGKEGDWRWVFDRGRVLEWDDDGTPILIVGTGTDITQRREAALSFAESEEKFHSLFNTARDAIFIADAETGLIVDANDAAGTLMGINRDKLVGMHQSALHPTEESERYKQLFADHIQFGREIFIDLWIQRPDGARIPVDVSAALFVAGGRRLIQGTFRDATDRKRAERAIRESEQRFRTIFESEPECVKLLDARGQLLDMNPAGLAMIEADSIDEVRGHAIDSLIVPEYRGHVAAAIRSVFEGRSEQLKFEIVGLRGTHRWMDSHQVPLRNGAQEIVAILAVSRDITDHRQAEEALRDSEHRFRSVFEQAGVAVGMIEAESGRFIEVNNKYAQLIGYSTDELAGRAWMDFVHPDDVESGQKNINELTSGRISEYTTEKRLLHNDGTVIWIKLTVSVTPESHRILKQRIVIAEDITDRKRADEELRVHAAQQAAVAEFGHLALSGVGIDKLLNESVGLLVRILKVDYAKVMELQSDGQSMRFRANAGWNAEMATERVISINSRSQAGMTLNAREPVSVDNLPEDDRFELTQPLRDHDVTSGMTVVIDGRDQPFGIIGAHTRDRRVFSENDINFLKAIANVLAEAIARFSAEDSVRESEEQYRILLENHVDGVLVVVDDRIRYVNARMSEMCGYEREQLLQQSLIEFLEPEDRVAADRQNQALVRNAEEAASEYRLRHADGRILTVEISTRAVRHRGHHAILNVVRDITLRKELEEESRRHRDELAHFNRISTMGEMATGMAHELNQPLTSIATYASIGAIKAMEAPNAVRDAEIATVLQKIQHQSLRAGDIIHRLRRFVKKDRPEPTDLNMNDAVRSAASLMASECHRREVKIRLKLADDLPDCMGSVVQIEQIILNLMRNAAEAMQDVPAASRKLIVTSKRCEGDRIVVEVSDTGPGVNAEELETIFDAFVTTKSEGMGLGLAISRSIAEAHDGTLTAALNDGAGMSFRLTWPSASRTQLQNEIG